MAWADLVIVFLFPKPPADELMSLGAGMSCSSPRAVFSISPRIQELDRHGHAEILFHPSLCGVESLLPKHRGICSAMTRGQPGCPDVDPQSDLCLEPFQDLGE